MNQQGFFIILPTFSTTSHLFTPFFSNSFTQQTQFYGNFVSDNKLIEPKENNADSFHQDYEELRVQGSGCNSRKTMGQKNDLQKIQEYDPRNKSFGTKNKKVYEKDKQRNILPNAVSKLFFFMKSMNKSELLVSKILKSSKILSKYITTSKFYSYHNFLKSKMNRFMTQQTIKYLYSINDPEFILFSLEQQLCIIKINAILIRNFVKNHLYLQMIMSTSRTPKYKIKAYLNKYRIIQDKAQFYLNQAKTNLNFSILDQEPMKQI